LTVNITGTGSGEVVSEIGYEAHGEPLIECSYASPGPASGTCENELFEEEGFEYESLQAQPAPGSEFAGWTFQKGSDEFGFCGEKELAGQEHVCFPVGPGGGAGAEITATFNLEEAGPAFPTALTIAKTGEGTITSSPKGIECGGTCSHSYEKGASVTLTASPASGYAFNSWAGCTEHVGLTCKVTLSKATTVKAGFIATPSFTIEKAGSGQGKASATGISCDENCSTATSAIKTGTSVTVKVASAKGSEAASFEGGTGSASGCSGATCTFTISANSSVVVKFAPKPTKTLTVNLTGPAAYKGKVSGKGTIKGLTASAISCGTGCTTQTESFFEGDTVTLTAVAGTGYKFAGWTGSEAGTCTGTTSPCTISTSANKTLSASFE
jgi:uncharacterized repeat protein (TIGR02543 family)